MARPLSWLPRLADIRRSVSGSVRTHYDRPALEQLFQMQPRAAGKLLAMLPQDEPLGRSRLVKKDELLRFLDQVHEADNATEVVSRQRAETYKVGRKKPRLLVRREVIDEAHLATLPRTITLSPGMLKVEFRSRLEMIELLAALLGAVENDFEEFEDLYVAEAEAGERGEQRRIERADVRALFEELKQMEEGYSALHLPKDASKALKIMVRERGLEPPQL
jgi:hypothetical protein